MGVTDGKDSRSKSRGGKISRVKTLLIIDGNPLVWRSVQTFSHLRTKSGVRTGCVFGALEKLIQGVAAVQPTSIVVCWDIGKSRWRRALYPAYKCSRESKPAELLHGLTADEVVNQMGIVKQILSRAGVHQIGVKGVEADDLIGILTSGLNLLSNYDDVVIMSQDRDLFQLLGGKVKYYEPVQKRWIEISDVQKKYGGFGPEMQTQIKAIMGDGGDDIPGVHGIGDIWAIKLLKQFGSLDALLDPASDVELNKSAKGRAVVASRDIVRMALKLVTIPKIDNFQQYFNPEETEILTQILWQKPKADRYSLVGLVEQYELKKFVSRIDIILRENPNFSGFDSWLPELSFEQKADLFWENR